jgi:hypothetical protein
MDLIIKGKHLQIKCNRLATTAATTTHSCFIGLKSDFDLGASDMRI